MQEFFFTALTIFLLRVVDVSLYTVRILMVVRGRKQLAWVFGFFQSFVFVVALRDVLANSGNWAKVIGYSAGFATGLIMGMLLEERLAIGYTHLRVISSRRGAELAEHLRSAGFAITEVSAFGKDGTVEMLNCNVRRRRSIEAQRIIQQIDPEAFVTSQPVRTVRRGFWG